MDKDPTAYLHLIVDSFDKIKLYVGNMSYDEFIKDGKTQSAVIMQLQIIGELAKTTPEEIRNSISIPWKEMSGLRDMIAHQYFRLDIETVWHTIRDSIPPIESKIKDFLQM